VKRLVSATQYSKICNGDTRKVSEDGFLIFSSGKSYAGIRPTVLVTDDDPELRSTVGRLLRSVGLDARLFVSVHDFLKSERPIGPTCLVLDVRLPGPSGLDFQREVVESDVQIPIIFITGHGDVPMSVQAMKRGAIEFLTKPFRDQDLIDAIQLGLVRDRAGRENEKASRLRMNLSQFEQTVGHRRRPHPRPCKARDHGGEIVSAVEAILELGEIAWHMLAVDGSIGASDRRLDVTKRRVDPLEGRRARRDRPAPRNDDLMGTPRLGHATEAAQAIADHRAVRREAGFGEGGDRMGAETRYAPQFQTDWLARPSGTWG
jgi:FixJ family two-component response regulator